MMNCFGEPDFDYFYGTIFSQTSFTSDQLKKYQSPFFFRTIGLTKKNWIKK